MNSDASQSGDGKSGQPEQQPEQKSKTQKNRECRQLRRKNKREGKGKWAPKDLSEPDKQQDNGEHGSRPRERTPPVQRTKPTRRLLQAGFQRQDNGRRRSRSPPRAPRQADYRDLPQDNRRAGRSRSREGYSSGKPLSHITRPGDRSRDKEDQPRRASSKERSGPSRQRSPSDSSVDNQAKRVRYAPSHKSGSQASPDKRPSTRGSSKEALATAQAPLSFLEKWVRGGPVKSSKVLQQSPAPVPDNKEELAQITSHKYPSAKPIGEHASPEATNALKQEESTPSADFLQEFPQEESEEPLLPEPDQAQSASKICGAVLPSNDTTEKASSVGHDKVNTPLGDDNLELPTRYRVVDQANGFEDPTYFRDFPTERLVAFEMTSLVLRPNGILEGEWFSGETMLAGLCMIMDESKVLSDCPGDYAVCGPTFPEALLNVQKDEWADCVRPKGLDTRKGSGWILNPIGNHWVVLWINSVTGIPTVYDSNINFQKHSISWAERFIVRLNNVYGEDLSTDIRWTHFRQVDYGDSWTCGRASLKAIEVLLREKRPPVPEDMPGPLQAVGWAEAFNARLQEWIFLPLQHKGFLRDSHSHVKDYNGPPYQSLDSFDRTKMYNGQGGLVYMIAVEEFDEKPLGDQ